MLSFKLVTIKMGEFKFFTIMSRLSSLGYYTVHFLMYTLLTHTPKCSLAVNLHVVAQEHHRAIGEEKIFKVVNLILF